MRYVCALGSHPSRRNSHPFVFITSPPSSARLLSPPRPPPEFNVPLPLRPILFFPSQGAEVLASDDPATQAAGRVAGPGLPVGHEQPGLVEGALRRALLARLAVPHRPAHLHRQADAVPGLHRLALRPVHLAAATCRR